MPQHASLVVSQERESTKKQKNSLSGQGGGQSSGSEEIQPTNRPRLPQGIVTQSTTLIGDSSLFIQERNSESYDLRHFLEVSFLPQTLNPAINPKRSTM